jgi:hypothetical protein
VGSYLRTLQGVFVSKRDKNVARLHSELKAKETSLKAKIKNAIDETEKSKFTAELYDVQHRLSRGAPNFGVEL